jgi:penicillin-binding protein 2
MTDSVRIKDLPREQHIFVTRSVMAMSVAFALMLVLIGKLIWLQIFRHDYYLDLSQGNRLRRDPIPASRGLILDRHGTVLVDNEPTYQLELISEQTPDLAATLRQLHALGLLNNEEIEQAGRAIRSRRKFDSVPIRLRMSDEEIGRFAVHRHEFQGVDLRTRETRHYPYGELGVHALGYVASISEDDLKRISRIEDYAGTNLIGKLGVEASFEKPLHGTNGYREILVNAQGRSVERSGNFAQMRAAAPVAGSDLVLAIDLAAQQAAEAGLGTRRGAVVAIDPANGDVIALASRPGFDPTLFGRGIRRLEYAALTNNPDKPLLNRALRGTYPSGSTIKPVIALAGMHFNLVDPDKREFCAGSFHLPHSSHLYREGKSGRHGAVNLRDAIAKSCDVYFYGLAATLGVDRIAEFLSPFGFGQLTGIDISGERAGLLPTPAWKKNYFKRPQDQVWFPGETVSFGIGQGYFLVTPLQLAHAASVMANRGKSFEPRLVAAERTADGKLKPIAPIAGKNVEFVSSEQWDIMLQGMIGATTYGTAGGQFIKAGYTVAGKTGTAQVYSVGQNEKYRGDKNELLRDHAWFIAFAPAEAPRIAICVLVENAGFGASMAAPIARRVIDAYFKANGILPAPAAPATTAAPAASAPTVPALVVPKAGGTP